MNLIAASFAAVAIFTLPSGIIVNYFSHWTPELFIRFFRFGRANVSKSTGGFMQKLEVPKRWFWHFYVWAVLLQTLVVITVWNRYVNEKGIPNGNWLDSVLDIGAGRKRQGTVSATATSIAVTLFWFHVVRRLVETLFIAVYSGTRMNVGHYFVGYFHYTCATFAMLSNSYGLTPANPIANDFTFSWLELSPEQYLGIFIIFFGNYQQFLAHKAFADLRKGKDKNVVTKEHKIPNGGLFNLVSCPNYFAEIMIYVGYLLLLGLRNYNWLCCTGWVISNQVVSGIMNHKWYQEKFREQYPKNRKAVIPYIL